MIIENEGIDKKVKTLDELVDITRAYQREKKKVVLCHGVFDGGIHPGHIQYFSDAKKQGDILIVTVTKDEYVDRGPGRPIVNDILRAETVGSVGCVDFVAINPYPTAVETITNLRPDIYAKGREFAELKDDTGKISKESDAVKAIGGILYFTQGITLSSSNLINENFCVYTDEGRRFLRDFKKKFSSETINEALKSLKSLKVLIIGEAIVDEYHYCKPLGKSPKENLITYQFINKERFAGGAAATANNVANFCKDVQFISLLGDNLEDNEFIIKNLKSNISSNFIYDSSRPTIKKIRGVDPAFYRKLFAEYLLDEKPINQTIEDKIMSALEERISNYDITIVSDYGHNFITPKIVSLLCEKSNFLAVNAQTNSANVGFNLIDKYPSADYVCIDHAEARLAAKDMYCNLREVGEKVRRLGEYKNVVITAGHKGSFVFSPEEGWSEIPVFSSHVVDTMGAGDSYFSITAPCVYKKYSMEEIGFIGNAAGALAVLTVGNRTSINPGSLYKFIMTLLK